ncbi:MAG: 3-keto-5-aminohexanoate cleavage protein [Candidatus Dormiibacterota bacterium]
MRLPEELAGRAEADARVRGMSVKALIVEQLTTAIDLVASEDDFTERARKLLAPDNALLDRLASRSTVGRRSVATAAWSMTVATSPSPPISDTARSMLLQATLNGPLTKVAQPGVPVTMAELVADASDCAAVGARAFHVHPRDETGAESLDARVVDQVVLGLRTPLGMPVGVTTGGWIVPNLQRRLRLIREWTEPGYASVNLSEPGAVDVMKALSATGIGIEAGVCTVAETELLVRCGLAERVTRVMIEPVEVSRLQALPLVDAMHQVLDRPGSRSPRLQHGDGEATWILIEDAIRRGIDTRVGFEDTLLLPNGKLAASNAELVSAAYELGAGRD